jgi:hypothetical protein
MTTTRKSAPSPSERVVVRRHSVPHAPRLHSRIDWPMESVAPGASVNGNGRRRVLVAFLFMLYLIASLIFTNLYAMKMSGGRSVSERASWRSDRATRSPAARPSWRPDERPEP